MTTLQDFKTEVQALVQQAMTDGKIKQETITDAMIWLIANLQADDFLSMLTSKDLAELLVKGIKKIDQEAVDTYLYCQYDMIADQLTEEDKMIYWTCFTKRVEIFLFV